MGWAPSRWTVAGIVKYVSENPPMGQDESKKWYPARPLGLYSVRNRLRLAWAVFTGKADALFWEFK